MHLIVIGEVTNPIFSKKTYFPSWLRNIICVTILYRNHALQVEWVQHANKSGVFFHEENIFSLWTLKVSSILIGWIPGTLKVSSILIGWLPGTLKVNSILVG